MTKRIFNSVFLTAITVLLASAVLIIGSLYGYFSVVQKQQLRSETILAAKGAEDEGISYFTDLDTSAFRVTWIAADGRVIYDSGTDSGEMENHIDREEIKEALENGAGESERYSATMLEHLLYCARRLKDGSVIRLSVTQSSVLHLALGMLQPIIFIFLAAGIISYLMASRLSKRIVKPLNELDLDNPAENEDYDEISPLLRHIEAQKKQILSQKRELELKKQEFETVTDNMNEGLLLLDKEGRVITLNPAAARILETDKGCIGKDILIVNRSPEMQELLREAEKGSRAERIIEIGEGKYQLDSSPVSSEKGAAGTVLLIFDVTEREKAEQLRREFTANVSHELKTPLHSISGCAELINNDMVKPEDLKRFSGQIYSEAQRMISLVEDIIRLSRLDEGAQDLKREDTDLLEIAKTAVNSLTAKAEKAEVSLEISGESAVINGIPQLLSAVATNLCDNAIKYNRKGGRVLVTVEKNEDYAVLTVKDSGIGIPPEHISRIFERFYRVDKSRSKEAGGTGLGLSIVKHAAKLHNAEISVDSKVGEGTEISVKFPLN